MNFVEGCNQGSQHDQQGQASQSPRRMQPKRTNLDRTFDEIEGLFDTHLFFVLFHYFARREPFHRDVCAEQNDAIFLPIHAVYTMAVGQN